MAVQGRVQRIRMVSRRRETWQSLPMHAQWTVRAVAGLATVVGMLGLQSGSSAATGGVPLPAESGSTWRVIAGYNSGTHTGEDPHALDWVRVDSPTAGSVVLSPVDGALSYVGPECLAVRDANGMEHLLCHLWPDAGLVRDQAVRQGQPLGSVAPDGYAGNNGIAHIHYAVHYALGGGYLGQTVPFSGAYALEGQELASSGEYSQWAGLTLTSSNQPAVPTAPAAAGTEAAADPDYLFPGWNLVGWGSERDVIQATALIKSAINAVLIFDARAQQYRRYDPALPAPLNDLAVLPAGSGLWVHVTAPGGVIWRRPTAALGSAIGLTAGDNLVQWTGARTSAAAIAAVAGPGLVVLQTWDAAGQRYRTFRPEVPAALNELQTVDANQALWIQVRSATAMDPLLAGRLPPPAAAPTPAEPPASSTQSATAQTGHVLGPGCLNLRPAPTTVGATPLTCLSIGTRLALTGDQAVDAAGRTWLAVQVQGLSGWVAASYVAVGEWTAPQVGDVVEGVATYYHPSLAGQPMACGGVYAPTDVSIAAATAWPCGAVLQVSRGDRSILVRVQDTGYLPPNHVDLSEAAFGMLATPGEGTVAVTIVVVALP